MKVMWTIFSGLGNYDINVVTAALNCKNCDIIWFDKRKDPSIIKLGTVFTLIMIEKKK